MASSFALGLALTAVPAWAQSDTRNLLDRIDRMERELSTLQRQVYRGESPPPSSGGSGFSGMEGGTGADIATRLDIRINQLESAMRALEGQVEEARYGTSQFSSRLDRLSKDVDFRLKELEQKQSNAPAADSNEGQGMQGMAGNGKAPAAAGMNGMSGMAGAPKAAVAPLKEGKDAPPPPPKNASPHEQYQYAFNLLRQSDYENAERTLKQFIEQHPSDSLAGNAQYWLGETHFARKDYQQAAVSFLTGYQKYPKNPKAADSLLKLGVSLGYLNQKKEACAALSKVLNEYPDADTIKKRATQEKGKLSCG
ncbi:MAG: tol-pal system protein YbgF [Rhodospirillales bacterium]|nr:tol-pal system protein YbgF [Rhodospirillales bacterium]